mgnify:FL=1|jgi:hypothetical protein
MNISVESNIKTLSRRWRGLQKKTVQKATVTALNKMGKEVFGKTVKELSAVTGVKPQKKVRSKMKLYKASSDHLKARISIKDQFLNLIEFGAKQTKKGVRHKAWNRSQLAKGAFIASGRSSGKRLVFAREGEKRLPIRGLPGPSLPIEYFKSGVNKIMDRLVRKRFNVLFERALEFQFLRAMRKDRVIRKFG